jgi:hypothetical protein
MMLDHTTFYLFRQNNVRPNNIKQNDVRRFGIVPKLLVPVDYVMVSLKFEKMVYFMAVWYMFFVMIWYILRLFFTFCGCCGCLVHFVVVWYNLS